MLSERRFVLQGEMNLKHSHGGLLCLWYVSAIAPSSAIIELFNTMNCTTDIERIPLIRSISVLVKSKKLSQGTVYIVTEGELVIFVYIEGPKEMRICKFGDVSAHQRKTLLSYEFPARHVRPRSRAYHSLRLHKSLCKASQSQAPISDVSVLTRRYHRH